MKASEKVRKLQHLRTRMDKLDREFDRIIDSMTDRELYEWHMLRFGGNIELSFEEWQQLP